MSNKKENKINKDLKLKKNEAQKLSDEDVENASGGMGVLAAVATTIAIEEGIEQLKKIM